MTPLNYKFLTLAAVLATSPTHAQQEAVPVSVKPSTINVQVIEGVQVKLPDRSVFYQRVVPPTPSTPLAPTLSAPKPFSPAERAAAEARDKKKFETLMISATVYDRRVTELRWFVGDHEYSAWSNIDFNYLSGQGEIETEDTVYGLIMGIGDDTAESITAANQRAVLDGLKWHKALPPTDRLSSTRAEYLIEGSNDSKPPPEALAPMDALHAYYDANRKRLADEYEQREAAQLAREQWIKEHPPVPKDTVINFWPKKSRNYPPNKR